MSNDPLVDRLMRHVELAASCIRARRALLERLRREGHDAGTAHEDLWWTEHTLCCLQARLAALASRHDTPPS